jgi:ATP synthase I chain
MSVSELRARVAAESAVIVVVLALVAATLVGARVGLGVLAGGALAVASFWRLAGDAASLASGTAVSGRWLLASVLRFGGLAAVMGALLVLDWAHPAALVVGLTILPCDLVAQGLRLAHVQRER